MATFEFRVRGIAAAQAALRALGERAKAELAAALYTEGEAIMGHSKPLVPVDTGALRSTGHVQPPKLEARTVRVTLGYGGPAGTDGVSAEGAGRYVGYALKVHEDLAARHRTGQAKYLEQPAREASAGMAERLAKRLAARLG